MNHEPERILYIGGPSQVINYNTFIVCLIILIAVMLAPSIWNSILQDMYGPEYKTYYIMVSKVVFFIPWVWGILAWLTVRAHRYTISTERLKEEEGLFSKTTEELELFRVKDITFVQPFSLRMFGCGNIILDTSDKSTPIVVLHAIKNAKPVIELLRKNVQIMRTKKGVREID